jgi:hypothetical protein
MKKHKLVFLVFILLPLMFLTIGFLYKNYFHYYFLTGFDPEYAFLFNALNIAHLKLPWHIDHPGTPLQIFSALIIRIINLFRSNSLDTDILSNPEFYLYWINAGIVFVNTLCIFLLGYIVFKKTKKILLGLLLQLTPFISYYTLTLEYRVLPENFIISISTIFILFIVLYMHEDNLDNKKVKFYIIIFSFIVGLGITTKILFAPLALIPVFLFEKNKHRLYYVLTSFLITAILLFPVYNQWVTFRNWIESLFIHDGIYGSGESNVVNGVVFKDNLITIFTTDYFFRYTVFSMVLGIILYHLPFLKIKEKNDKLYRGLLGATIAIIMVIILVSKHYKYYYLTPAILLTVLGIYFLFTIYTRNLLPKYKNYALAILLIFSMIGAYFLETSGVFVYNSFLKGKRDTIYYKTNQILENNYKQYASLIVPKHSGTAYKESALFFGLVWGGPALHEKYCNILNKIYPKSYYFHTWNNKFNTWDNAYTYIDLLKKYKEVILYISYFEAEDLIKNKVHGMNRQLDTKFELVYKCDETQELIYKVKYDSLTSTKTRVFHCNSELVDTVKNELIDNNGIIYGSSENRTNEKAKSGKFSIKLTDNTKGAFSCVLSEVSKGDRYKISVWRYKTNVNAGLVINTKDTSKLNIVNYSSKLESNNWQLIESEIFISDNINYDNILIACRKENDPIPVYFDDFTIEKIN